MFRWCLVWASLAWLAGPALAAERTTFRVGVEKVDYYPYFASDATRFRGYARDVLDAYAASRGLGFQYESLPVDELFRLFLDSERLDFKFPDSPRWHATDKAGKQVRYSRPIGVLSEGLLVRRADAGRPLGRLRTVGILKGFTGLAIQREVRAGRIRLVENTSLDALLQQLALGRLDAVYAELQVAQRRLVRLRLADRLVADRSLPVARYELRLSSRQHPARLADFDRFLVAEAGQLRALRGRYGLTP